MKQLSARTWEMDDGRRLVGVHPGEVCAHRACVIHNPSGHHMVFWPLHYRNDRNIFERICRHGVGHPDPDQFAYWEETDQMFQASHGCDGCCWPSNAVWTEEEK